MKNILKPLARSVLIKLGLIAVAPATDAAIQKIGFGSVITTLIISDEKIDYIMKIVKPVGESGLLIKSVRETIKIEAKEKKGGFIVRL